MSVPLTVTARLDTLSVGLGRRPLMLDGPLAWAYSQRALSTGEQLEPITEAHAMDFPLPLERVDVAGTWVWATSQADLDIAAHAAIQVRRKPATQAMARYSTDRAHHSGLGPYKARDATLPAEIVLTATWHVLCTDRGDLEDLLRMVTHLGARHRNGQGHVATWDIDEGEDVDAWRRRPMPSQSGPVMGIRAPYWHPSRRSPCLTHP